MNILETHHISKRFDGVHAVDALSIALEKGKITGIVGPNGSGKSTLVNLLTGLFEWNEGTLLIEGVKLKKLRPFEAPAYGVTRTFQEVRLFNQMSVEDNILVVLGERSFIKALFERSARHARQQVVAGRPARHARQQVVAGRPARHARRVVAGGHAGLDHDRCREILQQVGLWEKRNALAGNISYGQRKLLEIGRALAMTRSTSSGQAQATDSTSSPQVSIILFDEPFAGLFPEMIKTITGIISNLKETGKTIVLIEHNMQLIRQLCDHLVVMDSGKLLAQGKPGEVLSRKDVIEAYLGE